MKSGYFFKHFTGTVFFFMVLFLCAGRIDYWQGWAYVAIGLVMFLLHYTVLRPDAQLLEERSKPGEGAKKWDKLLLGFSFLLTIAMYVLAGLDSGRYHWSPEFHRGLSLTGAILTISGQLLFLVAQKQNKFFSSTVRMQDDREHTVCDTGLYRIVRHPAYAGSIIQLLGFPLLLGSLWSLIPCGLLIVIFVLRTIMEDKALTLELEGYTEYLHKTRYRLIPFLF